MRIAQAYISESVANFPWLEKLGLRPYDNPQEPAIFFGMYRPDDIAALCNHEGLAVVRWCGVDSLSVNEPSPYQAPMVYNISPFPQVKRKLAEHGIKCHVISLERIYPPTKPLPYGDMIYAYAPPVTEDYYGQSIIDLLRKRGYNILIGDGTISREEWDNGKADELYSQCYIGLVLSPYVGGGASVVELGLRGRICITNVLSTANTLPWRTIDDIIFHLDLWKRVGSDCINQISEQTHAALKDADWLNTEYYVSL